MPSDYFSDRERGRPAQVLLEVDAEAWAGLLALVRQFINKNGFAVDYPIPCQDNQVPIGTDRHTLESAIRGEIPQLDWQNCDENSIPPTAAVMDLLEFCHTHVADAKEDSHHSFFDHYHLTFDRAEGQRLFRERVNTILSRNKLAYELKDDGTVSRLVAPVFGEILDSQSFCTGEANSTTCWNQRN